jgi:hypothetical protein
MMATYKVQIDGEVRNATSAEVAQIEAQRAEAVAQAEALVVKQAAREALLTKLGITEQEAQLLLGS